VRVMTVPWGQGPAGSRSVGVCRTRRPDAWGIGAQCSTWNGVPVWSPRKDARHAGAGRCSGHSDAKAEEEAPAAALKWWRFDDGGLQDKADHCPGNWQCVGPAGRPITKILVRRLCAEAMKCIRARGQWAGSSAMGCPGPLKVGEGAARGPVQGGVFRTGPLRPARESISPARRLSAPRVSCRVATTPVLPPVWPAS